MKIKAGMTVSEVDGRDLQVWECLDCTARDFDPKDCYWCTKMKKEFHEEEANRGMI